MLQNFQNELEKYRDNYIIAMIEKQKDQFYQDNYIQISLKLTNNSIVETLKAYFDSLLQYQRSLSLPNSDEVAIIFSQLFIPTQSPFIQGSIKLKMLVETINSGLLYFFKKQYEEYRRNKCPQIIQNQIEHDFSHCICNLTKQSIKSFKEVPETNALVCLICCFSFHDICLRYKIQKQFVCPLCVLKNLDLLHKYEETLGVNVLLTKQFQEKKTEILFHIDKLEAGRTIDIRCIRLDGQRYEQSWPDNGELIINGTMVEKFDPLSAKSASKYRKDRQYTINDMFQQTYRIHLRQQSVTQELKENKKITTDQLFVFGAFIVTRLTPQQFINNTINDKQKWLNIKQMQDNIFKYSQFNQQENDLEVSKISINFQCQITFQIMKIPARGILCEHIQCFCLENFVNVVESLQHRQWKCPVCKKICLDIQIDGYQQCILDCLKQKYKKPTELMKEIQNVTFDKNGHYLDNILNQSDYEFQGGRNYLYEYCTSQKPYQINQIQMSESEL